jgi:hypothetical protein
MPGPYQSKEVYRPIEDVTAEMTAALDLGFERFFISDNLFTSRREYCLSLCDMIKSERIADRCSWVCMTRVEFVDPELLRAMRKAGCVNVAFGVETASVNQWKTLRKGRFSEEAVQSAFRLTREAGIGTTAYLMLGSPSQTETDVDSTIDLIREIDPDFRVVSYFQPFPGTPYWQDPEKFGLSEIAPFEDWNFHEAPICRTKHFTKPQLEEAAVKLYLQREKLSLLNPSIDAIEVNDCNFVSDAVPPAALDALSWANSNTTLKELLERVDRKHGSRGRLIALYWLSAALKNGVASIAHGIGASTGRQPNILFSIR